MIGNRARIRTLAPWLLAAAFGVLAAPLVATAKDKDEDANTIPTCDKKFGTMAVDEPEQKWWLAYQLESPAALIKVYAAQSGCFTLLDRGKGLEAAQKERALASGGEMRGGSNIGKGQMKAADYVLVPDIANQNGNSGGKRLGGGLGGMLGHKFGAVLGGVSLKSKTADVVLTLTDVRSTEQVAVVQGHAKKTDVGWGAAGGMFSGGGFAAAGASSYANTEIGQVVAMAYLDAWKKMVVEVEKISPDAKAANVSQSVTMSKAGKMFSAAAGKGKLVRDLDAGMTLYPTGTKDGIWWEVDDELGNRGWVNSTLFGLAK
jgi:curli biogenesis system outer membrane secretion channel CsgG